MNVTSVLAVGPGGNPTWATAGALKQAVGVSGEELGRGEALALWVGQLLFQEVPDRQEAIGGFLAAVRSAQTWNHWQLLAQFRDPRPPALVLTAGTHLNLTGLDQTWELAGAGRWVATVPPDWLESRVFNLKTLYAALTAKAERHRENTEKAKTRRCTTQPPPASGPTPTPPPSA